jgi:hypothetical protein
MNSPLHPVAVRPLTRRALLVVPCLLWALASAGCGEAQAAEPVPAEARIALDKLEIMELASRFENTFDRGDLQGHLDTWVDDLNFESPFGNYTTKAAYTSPKTIFTSAFVKDQLRKVDGRWKFVSRKLETDG